MDLVSFMNQNLYIVSIALFILGLIIKQTPFIPNWSIPYILGVLGILTCNFILGFSVNASIQGVIVTGVAVYAHQLGKQCISCVNQNKSSTQTDENEEKK